MHTVLWETSDGEVHFVRCESRTNVMAFLISSHLQDDKSVIIYTPDAEEHTMTVEDIFASV